MEKKEKPKLGKKEIKILAYLTLHGGEVWVEDIYIKFARAKKYRAVLKRRLFKLQQKGFIVIGEEINPLTKRKKQKVYLLK